MRTALTSVIPGVYWIDMVISEKLKTFLSLFSIPIFVLAGIIVSLILDQFTLTNLRQVVLFVTIAVGSFELVSDTLSALYNRRFALDYIAILAIVVGLLTGHVLVAAVITLMLAGGNTLEKYGKTSAQRSLTALVDRIPNEVYLWSNGQLGDEVAIESVQAGQEIAIRKGEVIPLDGRLLSPSGLTDESSLTGEPYELEKLQGDQIRSGTVNIGELMVIKVTASDTESTYRKIIEMVKSAQREKSPLIRLADGYSTIFTVITLTICAVAYLVSHDFARVLAVLVIATPCPLILATPIALMGGMNAAAKQRIILKNLSSLEALSRVHAIIFDKTGTITLGRPIVTKIIVNNRHFTEKQAIAIAAGIERNSLHPVAKALVEAAKKLHAPDSLAQSVTETIGHGISGLVDGQKYTLTKVTEHVGMAVALIHEGKNVAVFELVDELKDESASIIKQLQKWGLELLIFTGDKATSAADVVKRLGIAVTVKAECTPADKKAGIAALKKAGKVTAMVGDGINDAPALASADVGMVFSSGEQTAASEAADVVFLGGDFSAVTQVLGISRRTIAIAMQSITVGIGLSVVGMLFAAAGYISPVVGAFLQEAIDVAVIFNALRASKN